MWIEQSDNEDLYRKKREKKEAQESLDFFESKKLKQETSVLLSKLANEIAKEFWIDVSEVQRLISWSTLNDLNSLKSSIKWSWEWINIGRLQDAITSARNKIEAHSKKKIESLKHSVDQDSYSPEYHEFKAARKILSTSIMQRAYQPQSYTDQLVWVGIWFIDTSEAVVLFTYGLAKWILLTPYHIYLMVTWKGSYDFSAKI